MSETVQGKPAPSIKIVGVGGGGVNTINRMLTKPIPGCEYIVCNTDIKSLDSVLGALSVQIGEHLTHGFGAGGDPRVGERAAEEGRFLLQRALKDAELVFITAGMGGGTGTGATPLIAQIAKESHALVIGIVTMPFSFEGKRRLQIALDGISRLRREVDNLIIIDNERLLRHTVSHNLDLNTLLHLSDQVIIEGITALCNAVGPSARWMIGLPEVKAVMELPGGALMAIAETDRKSPYPAQEATEAAIANPLLGIDLKTAQGVLFIFSGGPELTVEELIEGVDVIATVVDPKAITFYALSPPTEELRNTVKLTLIATGIHPPLPSSWPGEMGDVFHKGRLLDRIAEGTACSVCGRKDVPLETYDINAMSTIADSAVSTATKLANVNVVCRSCHRLIDIAAPNRTIADLQREASAGYQLERRVVRVLKRVGCAVISGITGPDAGVDTLAYFVEAETGKRVSLLIQCKSRPLPQLGTGEIDPFAAKVQHYGSKYGVIVSDFGGSEDAKNMAQTFGLRILTFDEFVQFIYELSGTK